MSKWPSNKAVESALKELENTPASRPLVRDASPVERIKYSICGQFVKYMNSHRISQQQLADLIGINKSLISKITHYRYDEFTIDRLIKYLAILDPKLQVEIKARVA